MRIKNRFFLVAFLVVSQAACLGFGMVWATGWLWKEFEEVVHSNVVSQGKAIAHGLALKTADLGLKSVEPGTPEWKEVQALCEQAEIPHAGFACLMRYDNGAMLCHPNLSIDPGLLRLFPGRGLLISDTTTDSIISVVHQAVAAGRRVVQGKVELDGTLHVVTAYSLPKLNVVLAVYQSDMAIDLFIASTIRPVMQVGYALVAFIIGATAIVTVFLTERYETSLAVANAQLEEEVQQRTRSLLRTRNAVIFGLAKLTESRDRDTGEHLERIRAYVTILASELAKTHQEIDHLYVADLAVASSLHDIGKVGIPDAVLLKRGPLTPVERKAMELHTVLGSECLAVIRKQLEEDDFLEIAQQIAIAHHEHWDGSGYPNGTQGKNIPLAARIVALADVYDALTNERPYKGPIAHEEVRSWIATRYAEQFDPSVVEAFIAREQDFARVNSSYASKSTQCDSESLESAGKDQPVDNSEICELGVGSSV